MPRNDVIERMAIEIYGYGAEGWQRGTKETVRDFYRQKALELLAIVEYYTERIEDGPWGDGEGNEAYEITQHLSRAFQMAREAGEEREKNGG